MRKSSRNSAKPAALIDAKSHVEGFRKARGARRTELIEDYVELIADLIDAHGEARQIDIAQRLGVAQPTVAKMIKRLNEEGLITQRPYRGVFLAEAGQRIADASRRRHQIVEAFLLVLGVSPEVARNDAEGIEHHVSTETLEALERFVGASENRRITAIPPVPASRD